MARELPYFKFNVTQWLTGDINYEDYKTQGVFIKLCAEYWNRDCDLNLSDIKKRINDDETLKYLQKNGFFSVKNKKVKVKFLDLELLEITDRRLKLSEAGRKGGLSKRKATLKPALSIKDIDIEVDKDIEVEKKEKAKPPLVYFPNKELNEKYLEYLKFRKEQGKGIKETSIKANIKKLNNLSKENEKVSAEILEQSIANGWIGLFELKNVSAVKTYQAKHNTGYNDNNTDFEPLSNINING